MTTDEKKRFSTIDEYIAEQRLEIQPLLQALRQSIKNAVPEAQEIISYSMPAFKFHGIIAYFAAHKNHYGLYVPKILHEFEEELSSYVTSKGTVQFPYTQAFPDKLVQEIIKSSAKSNLERAFLKERMKKSKR